MSRNLLLLRGTGSGQKRAPLPTPPPDTLSVLPWDPPHTRDFLRADAWSITIPGLPFVLGGSSNPIAQQRFLSWFYDRYPMEFRQEWISLNLADGYTHAIVSPPDSLAFGTPLDGVVRMCGELKANGLYVHAMLGSKLYQPANMSADQYCAYAFPLMDALNGVVDEYCPAWEMDLWNIAGQTNLDINKRIGDRAHQQGASCWLHFSTHVTWWGQDGTDRFKYWNDLGGDVDGLDYQGDSGWSAAEWQARIVDTLHQFGTQGNQHKIRAFERLGTLLFDHPTPTEDDANLDGYLACCTIDNVMHTDAKVWGTAEGVRHLDGSPL